MWVNSQLPLVTQPPGTYLKKIPAFFGACCRRTRSPASSRTFWYLCTCLTEQQLLVVVETRAQKCCNFKAWKEYHLQSLSWSSSLEMSNVLFWSGLNKYIQWLLSRLLWNLLLWCSALPQKNVPLAMETLSRSPYSYQVINHKQTFHRIFG